MDQQHVNSPKFAVAATTFDRVAGKLAKAKAKLERNYVHFERKLRRTQQMPPKKPLARRCELKKRETQKSCKNKK